VRRGRERGDTVRLYNPTVTPTARREGDGGKGGRGGRGGIKVGKEEYVPRSKRGGFNYHPEGMGEAVHDTVDDDELGLVEEVTITIPTFTIKNIKDSVNHNNRCSRRPRRPTMSRMVVEWTNSCRSKHKLYAYIHLFSIMSLMNGGGMDEFLQGYHLGIQEALEGDSGTGMYEVDLEAYFSEEMANGGGYQAFSWPNSGMYANLSKFLIFVFLICFLSFLLILI
jgi:hypothetical protein